MPYEIAAWNQFFLIALRTDFGTQPVARNWLTNGCGWEMQRLGQKFKKWGGRGP